MAQKKRARSPEELRPLVEPGHPQVAWRLSNTLDGSFCLGLLEEALGRGRPEVFHTDQGVQFTAQAWTGRLEAAGAAAWTTSSWSGCGGR